MWSWWPGHDLGKWGLVLAVILFLFQRPWDTFQSFAITKTKKSWNTGSAAYRRWWLGYLETEIARLERDCTPISKTEEEILWGILCIGNLLILAMQLTGLISLFLGINGKSTIPSFPEQLRWPLGGLGASLLLITWVWKKHMTRIAKYRQEHSLEYREYLRRELILAKRGSAAAQSKAAHTPSDPSAPHS
jgi:hypothetical protein